MSDARIDLRRERRDRGYSISELADHLNLSVSVIAGAEAGRTPRPKHAFKLAGFYGYKVSEVWPLEDEAA